MKRTGPLTAETVKAAEARAVKLSRGYFRLSPMVELVFKRTGEKVHADLVDIDGNHPGTIHLVEKGYWWGPGELDWPSE